MLRELDYALSDKAKPERILARVSAIRARRKFSYWIRKKQLDRSLSIARCIAEKALLAQRIGNPERLAKAESVLNRYK